MSNILLSIIIPIKNEARYLQSLLNEFYLIEDDSIEIIISDNYSDDGSWDLLLKETKSNIKIVRPSKSCTAFENHIYALSQAQGKYVYPMGGDDIFLTSCLDRVMPLLKMHDNIAVIGLVKSFKDGTNELRALTNDPNVIKSFFVNGIFSIKKYLNYINYDEMFFAFVPRKNQSFMSNLTPLCYETFATWAVFHNYYYRTIEEVFFIDEVVLMKRCFHLNRTGQTPALELGGGEASNNINKFIGTLKNVFYFMKIHFDLKVLIYLLFKKRHSIGEYGKKRIHSPFIQVIGSQTLYLLRKYFGFK